MVSRLGLTSRAAQMMLYLGAPLLMLLASMIYIDHHLRIFFDAGTALALDRSFPNVSATLRLHCVDYVCQQVRGGPWTNVPDP